MKTQSGGDLMMLGKTSRDVDAKGLTHGNGVLVWTVTSQLAGEDHGSS